MRRLALHLPLLVLLTAFATAAPAQQEPKTPAQQQPKSAAGGRTANLPDFTALMKQQGPAVVIGLPYGLAVVKAGGLAERAGLKIGDVVYGINQKKVNNLDEFNRLLAAQQGGGKVGLLVRRGGSDFYVAVDLAGAPSRDGLPTTLPGSRETLLRT